MGENVRETIEKMLAEAEPKYAESVSYTHLDVYKRQNYTGLNFRNMAGWKVNSEIVNLKRDHDFIIIDSPPHVETDASTAIRASDVILIPMQPSPTDLWASKATIDLTKNEKVPFHIVMNRVNNNSKLSQEITKDLPNVCLLYTSRYV